MRALDDIIPRSGERGSPIRPSRDVSINYTRKTHRADHFLPLCHLKMTPSYERLQPEDTRNKRKRLSSLQNLHAFKLGKNMYDPDFYTQVNSYEN